MMDSLISTQESHNFHNFLTTIGDPSQWAMGPEIPKDKAALAKATKDLMALDHSYYTLPPDPMYPHNYTLPPPPNSDSSSRTPTPTSIDPYPPHIHLQTARPRPSHPHPYPATNRRPQTYPHPSHPPPTAPVLPAPPPPQPRIKPPQSHAKPALLSPSQKKANHIQSEQKRRANIRRGYEALCECVPALREAIRQEDEAAAGGVDSSRSGFMSGKGKKPRTTSRSGKDGEDKVDGRAGPRSENVVLSKTIDYISELLDERRTLLERLHRARSTLPPGHPALVPPIDSNNDDGPLWEREWKGGQGSLGDEEGDASS